MSLSLGPEFLPLTTEFTPPPLSECEATYSDYGRVVSPSALFSGFASRSSCYPSDFREALGTYSPGRCPRSYTRATEHSASSDGESPASLVTTAICCFSDHTYNGVLCTREFISTWLGVGPDSITRTFSTAGALAFPIEVRWQATDQAALGTAFPTPTTTPSSITSTSGASLASETSSNVVASATSTTMSTGAKAGIGAGVGVGVFLAVIIGLWYIFRVRRSRRKVEVSEAIADKQRGVEIDGFAKSDVSGKVRELEGETVERPAELHGTEGVAHKKINLKELSAVGSVRGSRRGLPELDSINAVASPGDTEIDRTCARTLHHSSQGNAENIGPVSHGPVPMQLQGSEHFKPVEYEVLPETTQFKPASDTDLPASTPTQDVTDAAASELRWLEGEEERIRARKAQLLSGSKSSGH